MKLRQYQQEATDIGVAFFKQKTCVPSLMICPTAWGKSLLCATIPKQLEGNTLVITTSKELLEQNYNKMIGFGGEASIYSASFNTKEFGKTTYATIQSLKGKGSEFKRMGYTQAILDEAQLFSRELAGMWRKFLKESGIKKVLMLTASPFKLETRTEFFTGRKYSKLEMLTKRGSTGAMVKDIIYVMQIQDIIKQGFWSKLEYELFCPETGELIYNSTGAEFTEESIQKWYKQNDVHDKILNRVATSDSKAILIFVPSVTNALELASTIPDSAAVWSGMPAKDRATVITDYRAGKIRTVINVNILSVGFDYEQISHIIDGCPSASLGRLYQKYGRGTRIHPDKEKCIITDFVGNVNRFGKIEELVFKKNKAGDWNLYSGYRQLTDIAVDRIQPMIGELKTVTFTDEFKYAGKTIDKAPISYLKTLLETHKWKSENMHIKEEILRIRREGLNKNKNEK